MISRNQQPPPRAHGHGDGSMRAFDSLNTAEKYQRRIRRHGGLEGVFVQLHTIGYRVPVAAARAPLPAEKFGAAGEDQGLAGKFDGAGHLPLSWLALIRHDFWKAA